MLAESNGGLGSAAIETSARRHIWLCADDYGISPSVNTAIRDLIVRGRLNATSVMVVAGASHRSEAIARLTLTAPFRPVSPDYKVPLQDGAFLPLGKTFTKACLHRLSRDALAAEVVSQLHAFVELFGRAPDFIDGHQHVHLFPQVSEALLSVVKDAAPNAWLRQCGRVLPLAQRFGDRKGVVIDIWSYGFRRRGLALGLPTNPAFAGTYDFSERPDFAALFPRFLDGLPDGSLVMCHPGFVDAELERLDPLTTLREQEYAFFAGDAFPALLAARGVALA